MIKIYKYLLLSVVINFVFPASALAESWGYVLAYYHYYQASYPSPKNVVWIEKTHTSYRIWVRPQSSTYYRQKTIVTNGIDATSSAGTVNSCTGGAEVIGVAAGVQKWEGTYARLEYNFCDGNFTTQSNVSGYYGFVSSISECWSSTYLPSSPTLSSCKSQDVLLGEFIVDSKCNRPVWRLGIVGGSSSVSYNNASGCDCTPAGTEFEEINGNNCTYTEITGDPALSPNYEEITYVAPGDIIIDNIVTSPPVTNPDNTVSQVETVTYPDNTQDIKTSVTTDNGDGTATIQTNTDRYLSGGGVISGYVSTTTTTYPDNSTRAVSTGVLGDTSVVLTGGGGSSTVSTSISGLVTTTTTTPTATTTTAGTGTGDGAGAGEGGSVWEEPPISYISPSLSGDPVFDVVVDVPSVTPDYNLLESAVNTLISSNPVISAVQGTRIDLSGADCSFEAEVFGKQFMIDFCGTASYLNLLGVGIVGLAAVRSVFLAMGIS